MRAYRLWLRVLLNGTKACCGVVRAAPCLAFARAQRGKDPKQALPLLETAVQNVLVLSPGSAKYTQLLALLAECFDVRVRGLPPARRAPIPAR
jgi:hypothetical protein